MLIAIAVVAGLVLAGFVGYKYGQKVEAEYTAAFQTAHSVVSAKLDAVKAEVAKVNGGISEDYASVVARIKALL